MTDTQADLTERARAVAVRIVETDFSKAPRGHRKSDPIALMTEWIAAFAQSERAAASAEARRAAIEECARVADTEEIPKDDGTVDAGLLVEQCGAYEVVRASCVATVNSIAKRIRALASPTPQEEKR